MKGIKIFTVGGELYFINSKTAADYLNVKQDTFEMLDALKMKVLSYWVDRPQFDDTELFNRIALGKLQLNYDWNTPYKLENGEMYNPQIPIHVLYKLIGYHINNKSDLGEYLQKFNEYLPLYLEKHVMDGNKLTYEEIPQIIDGVTKEYYLPSFPAEIFKDMYNELI